MIIHWPIVVSGKDAMRLDMQFKEGEEVITRDGEKAGVIDRVVIDPQTKKITHIVVQKGFLFAEDKVIPVEWFAQASVDRAVLDVQRGDIESLPLFEERHYLPWESFDAEGTYPPGHARPYFWYPPASLNWWADPGYRTYFRLPEPPYAEIDGPIPEGTVPLEVGAEVISADNEYVGDVERIFAEQDSHRVMHFIVSSGLIFKSKKLVPTAWVESIGEKAVYLSVSADFLDDLINYED